MTTFWAHLISGGQKSTAMPLWKIGCACGALLVAWMLGWTAGSRSTGLAWQNCLDQIKDDYGLMP